MRGMTGVGRGTFSVGIFQAGCGEKEPQFPAAPEGVEVSCDDYLFLRILDQAVELLELVLPVAIFQREVDDIYDDLLKFSLDNQTFDPLREIVQIAFDDGQPAQEGIRLLSDDRHPLHDRVVAVFSLNDKVVAEIIGDPFCLAIIARTVRAGIDLYQANNIRIYSTNEGYDTLKILSGFFEEPGIGNRQMETLFMAGTVTDIVE